MPEPELPPKLAGALRSLNRQKLVVPSSIDTAIAKAAKDHLQRSVGRAKASAEPPVAFSDDETATLATPQPSGDAGETPIKFIRPPAARPEPSPYRWLAAAAALVIGLFLLRPWERSAKQDLRADLDHSGQVDILDAFVLARRLETGAAGAELDLNGDGIVDQHDVDVAVNQAVRLPTGI